MFPTVVEEGVAGTSGAVGSASYFSSLLEKEPTIRTAPGRDDSKNRSPEGPRLKGGAF